MSPPRIKILHVTFNMGLGGTEQVINHLVRSVAPDRHDCALLCIDGTVGPLGQQLSETGHSVYRYRRRPGLDLGLVRFIRQVVRAEKFDLVHCHQYTPYFYGLLGSVGTGAKVVFTEHGRFYPDRSSWKRRMVNPQFARWTAAITAISEATKRALVTFEAFPEPAIEVVYNGIADPAECFSARDELRGDLGLTESDYVVGTVSRLDPIKNQAMMLRAFQRAASRYPDLKLLIVGDGPCRRDLEALARELAIGDRTIFAGAQPDPMPYLDLMNVFLLSSFSEGTSMTLLEAMALGKPCLATNVGGNPEVVKHGETGLLVGSDEMEQFAKAMMWLHENPTERCAFGAAARRRFLDHFHVRRMAAEYEAIYAQSCTGSALR